MPYLTRRDKDNHETAIPLPAGQPFTVGRGAASSLTVRDPKLSRVHCEFSVSAGTAVITDLGSMNGTYVNTQQIVSIALKDGDVIRMGYTKFVYHGGEIDRPASQGAVESADRPTPVESPEPTVGIRTARPASPVRTEDVQAKQLAPDTSGPKPTPAPKEPPDRAETPQEPSNRAVAASLKIVHEQPERRLKKSETQCCSCRHVVTAKQIKSGAATHIHGQACCPACIEADPLLGQTVAGYRIDAKLGSGTWTTTYKAEQMSMARSVVLQVLRAELAGDSELVTQFLAAVKRAGQISHPNLARIYDIGRAGEFCYVCGEYIDGDSLRQSLGKKDDVPVEEAVDIVAQVAGAVDAAHRRGVFHRDIRPSNIIRNEEEIPKLVGLGFAESLEGAAVAGGVSVRRARDLVMFWAPECLVDPTRAGKEADVYSLGAVLYATVAGHPPFEVEDDEDLVGRVRWLRAKPLDALRNDVPHRLSAVVARAMAKSPDDRYPDCQRLIRDLRSALQ